MVLDVNGVGYLVFVAPSFESECKVGDQRLLHTSFVVREDAFTIFGFESREQLRLFDTLRSVSGVGPKTAMSIISQLGVEKISQAVANQDDKAFASVNGIGPKTAKLLTLALEGKISGAPGARVTAATPVLTALSGLGWPERQAEAAIKVASESLPSSASDKDLLRAALAVLANDKGEGSLRS